MSNVGKINFSKVIRDVQVPNGHALNVSQFVRIEECIIVGLKSHDSHILMQQIMHIALRGSLPYKLVRPLIEFSLFFRGICSKTLSELDLNCLQSDIIIIVCKLEQIFSSEFFISVVHVVVYLFRECRLGRPVALRWT
jgi:hypothetical protein